MHMPHRASILALAALASAGSGVYDIEAEDLQSGLPVPMSYYRGKEPGTSDEILAFSQRKQAKFDFFRKVEVNGPGAHPLFKWLLGASGDCVDEDSSCAAWADSGECSNNREYMASACKLSCKLCSAPKGAGEPIKWNFESFLISRNGKAVGRFATGTDLTSSQVTRTIEAQLDAKTEL